MKLSRRLWEVPQGSFWYHFRHHLGVLGTPEAGFWGTSFRPHFGEHPIGGGGGAPTLKDELAG